MRRVLTIALILVAGWLLYDGETYIHALDEDTPSFLPGVQRVELSYRHFAFLGRGVPEEHRYDSVDPYFRSFTERASSAGTWLFASLAVTIALLLLSLVPRLRRLYLVGCAAAVVSVGVYAIQMETADWRVFREALAIRGSHGPSVYAWLLGGLGAAGLLHALVRVVRPRLRASDTPIAPPTGFALPRTAGVLLLAAMAWLIATDALWSFEVGDPNGPRGTDWGSIELGLLGARDVSGAVGFKTKRNEQSYAKADLPRGAPPAVKKLWATARHTGRIAFWTCLLAAAALLAAGFVPRLSSKQRATLQCVAGLALIAALLYAKVQLDGEADAAKARSRRLMSSPPDYGLTPAALATMLTAGLAAVAAFVSRRGASDPTDA